MLTRLKASGFKNLVDVDVRFGPFTCVAGANGVGKSNLFDAITFLSALADRPLVDAVLSVRDDGSRTTDLRGIFQRVGDVYVDKMSFQADMIVPYEGVDDLGQPAEASMTFLRYSVDLAYHKSANGQVPSSLQLVKEELVHINLGDAPEVLPFPHRVVWRNSVLKGRRTSPFISTEDKDGKRLIRLHQDGSQGRPLSRLAASLPRTVLSATNAAESPTALLARREMQSWRLLQLEPSSLRKPDEFTAPVRLGMDGAHLPATLYHLAQQARHHAQDEGEGDAAATSIYAQVANRLADLVGDVYNLTIDRDERRELLTLLITNRDKTVMQTRALSDGTLRFLALAILELDPQTQGVLCLEEPENGIHPARIPAILSLLQDIATDTSEPVGPDNPLRQVIVNTHSPAVVGQVPADSLLIAELRETVDGGLRYKRASFAALPDTWRVKASADKYEVPKGQLLAYLNPIASDNIDTTSLDGNGHQHTERGRGRTTRVVDRPDLQLLLPFPLP